MQDRIIARQVTPTVITVQLGALVTTLLWVFYGYAAGIPALAVSLFLSWRAIQTGFVLEPGGLLMRPYLPFPAQELIPWAKLASLDVDEVVVGTETRATKPRLRFMVHGATEPLQVIGCRPATLAKVLAAVQAQGVPVTDRRSLPKGS